jgi:hypothetical protein
MRRVAANVCSLGILAMVSLSWPTAGIAQEENPVRGAWIVTSWEAPDGTQNTEPQPGIFVFTEAHYSIMFVSSAEPRAQFSGDEMTDAEKAAAYNTITANSGRYEVSGDQLTTRAYVAKNPNYMGAWPENASTYTFQVEGDMLDLTWSNGAKATLRQVDHQPAPW